MHIYVCVLHPYCLDTLFSKCICNSLCFADYSKASLPQNQQFVYGTVLHRATGSYGREKCQRNLYIRHHQVSEAL